MLREVDRHFRAGGHGPLYHLVITQRVMPGRGLEATAEAMEEKRAAIRRTVRSAGGVGGCEVTHVKWSRHGGWHVHVHMIVEAAVDGGLDTRRVEERFCRFYDTNREAFFAKVVSEARTAEVVASFHDSLFGEPDAAGAAMGYVVGELTQGVNAMPELECPVEELEEFTRWVVARQLVRRWGQWRGIGKDVQDETKAAGGAEEAAPESGEECAALGTVDEVVVRINVGARLARAFVKWLHERYASSKLIGGRVRRIFPRSWFQ